MKLLHTSDWHLGKMIYGRSLLPEQEYFINQVFLPAVKEECPDFAILAGDIYDRQIAPVEAIRLFDSVISEMNARQIPLLVISGNHDGADRIAIGASLLREKGIYFANRIQDGLHPIAFQIGEERVHIYLLPYFEPADARAALDNQEIRGFHDAYAAVLERIKENLDADAINILVAHCFVTGCAVSDSESPLYIGGSGEVDSSLFAGFDYVALGHLHAPQKAGENGRYSGSPLKYSFDEANHKKSMTVVEWSGGQAVYRKLPVKPYHDMKILTGNFDELMAYQGQDEDFIYVKLTDDAPVYMPVEQLRSHYPNILGLSCEWMNKVGMAQNEDLKQTLLRQDIGDLSIFDAFLHRICGIKPTEDDHAVFEKACEQVKKEEEV